MFETTNLAGLTAGQSAQVTGVAGRAAMRRRLMDLGLIPGTRVTCLMKSPAGDPAAYLIRGAVIALRRADAETVSAERVEECTFAAIPAVRAL